MQTLHGRAETAPITQKTLEGHISLKNCPNWAFEVFFGIYGKCKCQKTPQTPDLDKFRVRYGLQKFFGSQNSCGRAEAGPAHAQTHAARALTGLARAQTHAARVLTSLTRVQTYAGRAQMAPESQKTLEGHISLETCPN